MKTQTMAEAMDTEDATITQAPSELAAPLASGTTASAAVSDAEREVGTSARPIRLCQRSGTSNTQAALREDSSHFTFFVRRCLKRHLQGEIWRKIVSNLIMKEPHKPKVLNDNNSFSPGLVIDFGRTLAGAPNTTK